MKKTFLCLNTLIIIILLSGPGCSQLPRSELDDIIGASQVGYKPSDKKIAVLALDKRANLSEFTVSSPDGIPVFKGRIKYWGDKWHKNMYGLDFTKLNIAGRYKVQWDGLTSLAFSIDKSVWRKEIDLDKIFNGFFYSQRCLEHLVEKLRYNGDSTHADLDINLPIYIFDSNGNEVYNELTFSDATGGWHDATSTDKETAKITWTAQQLLLAYQKNPSFFTSDPTSKDLPKILQEAKWGLDYLFKIQDVDGGMFLAVKPFDWWKPASLPRRLIINKDTGVTAKAVSCWATAYSIFESIDPEYAEKCLSAARKGLEWVDEHPNEYISDKIYPSYWTGKPSSVICALAELFLATKDKNPEEAKIYYAKAVELINKSEFKKGIWIERNIDIESMIFESKKEEASLKEKERIERYVTKARNSAVEEHIILALSRLYPYASGQMKEKIEYDLLNWYEYWNKARNNPYGVIDNVLTDYFGLNGWVLQIGTDMLIVGEALDNKNIMQIGKDQVQWVLGCNIFRVSFVVGIGEHYHNRPFKRLAKDVIGALMPGVLDVDRNGVPEVAGSYEWQTDEATLDYTGSLILAFSLMDSTD